jgi:hypothetical protein
MSRRRTDGHLFLTEGEIAERLGLSALEWQAAVLTLEKSGLPTPDPAFGRRRYWPAIRAYLDRRAGLLQTPSPLTRDGEENWDDDRGRMPRSRA